MEDLIFLIVFLCTETAKGEGATWGAVNWNFNFPSSRHCSSSVLLLLADAARVTRCYYKNVIIFIFHLEYLCRQDTVSIIRSQELFNF